MAAISNITRSLILTTTLILFGCQLSQAQSNAFTPAEDNAVLLKTLSSKYEQQFNQEIATLPSTDKKQLADLYKSRWDYIKEKFDSKEIYTSASAQQYLDTLVAEIVNANPGLQKLAFHCYFSKSGVPNAGYIGEGVILFNMGLFTRLENESQVAFVLCHEIAHFFLKHSENSIKNYVLTLNSKEVQQELQKIKNSEYKKHDVIEKLLNSLTFDSRRHSRDHEAEADSMAIELLRSTKFDTREALNTLAMLDSIDIDTIKTEQCLKQTFDAKEYPFQKKWITKEEGLLGGHAKLKEDEQIADSLKTHPDCKTRITLVEKLLHTNRSFSTLQDIIDKTTFTKLKNDFRYEIIEHAFGKKDYTASLYYTLQLLQVTPSDPYLVTQVGKILNGLFDAQKNHTLGKVTSLPSPTYPSNYNLLLQFVQNLYKEDLASINYYFLHQHQSQLQSYAPYVKEYNTSIKIAQQ